MSDILTKRLKGLEAGILGFHRELAEAYCARAAIYRRQVVPEKLLADLTEAIGFDGKLAEAYHERGSVYKAIGKDIEAKEDFDRATELGYKRQ